MSLSRLSRWDHLVDKHGQGVLGEWIRRAGAGAGAGDGAFSTARGIVTRAVPSAALKGSRKGDGVFQLTRTSAPLLGGGEQGWDGNRPVSLEHPDP